MQYEREGVLLRQRRRGVVLRTLKKELVYRSAWDDQGAAALAINEYIQAFYNHSRRHSANGYLSPVEYEHRHQTENALAA